MIDVIIPNYNGWAYLPTCLDALRRQTRRDFQVLVVDDGSTDDSLAGLAREYPEVRVLALDEPEIANHRRIQQTDRVAGGRVAEPREKLFGDRRATDDCASLDDADL